MVFAFYWLTQFMIAVEEFVVANVITIWYMEHQKDHNALRRAWWRFFRFHFGAVCAGSFVIALIHLFRGIVHFLEKKAKDSGADRNCVAKFCFSCIHCCLACCQKCVHFINKNAYTEVAIYGQDFLTSCCMALSILSDNMVVVATLNSVTYLLCLIIKLFIAASASFLAYLWLEKSEGHEEVVYTSAVAIFVAMISYFIADTCTDVFDMASDAMLICVLEDKKHNGTNMVGPPDIRRAFLKSRAAVHHHHEKESGVKTINRDEDDDVSLTI
jgi:hypothetical protein